MPFGLFIFKIKSDTFSPLDIS